MPVRCNLHGTLQGTSLRRSGRPEGTSLRRSGNREDIDATRAADRVCPAAIDARQRTGAAAGSRRAAAWRARRPARRTRRPRRSRGAQPGLEPRIVSFDAKPASVRAGEPVVLVWSTENPAGAVDRPGHRHRRAAREPDGHAESDDDLHADDARRSVADRHRHRRRPAPADAHRRASRRRAEAGTNGRRHPDFTGVYGSAGLPAGTTPPPLKPGAEKFRIVRGAR